MLERETIDRQQSNGCFRRKQPVTMTG